MSQQPNPFLSSTAWRIRHGAWLLAPILGVGLFSFVGVVYAAVRVRSRTFVLNAAATLAATATTWAMAWASGEDLSDPAALAILVTWVGCIVQGFALNRSYLRWRADQAAGNAWYLAPGNTSRAVPPASPVPTWHPAPEHPHAHLSAGNEYLARTRQPGSPDLAEPAPYVPEELRVAVNHATVTEVIMASGVSEQTAVRILAARDAHGGLRDHEHTVRVAGLTPQEARAVQHTLSYTA